MSLGAFFYRRIEKSALRLQLVFHPGIPNFDGDLVTAPQSSAMDLPQRRY